MSIYLYTCAADQDFDPGIGNHVPINLLELVIDHREGRAAVAGLKLPVAEPIPQNGWGIIITDDRGMPEPIFKGQFAGLPKKIDEVTKFVELVAVPVDLHQQVQPVIQPLVNAHVDSLFFKGKEQVDPSDYLEFSHELFCYDRVTHKLSLSSIFQGKLHQDFSSEILKDSLQFQIRDTPLPGIKLSLSVEWIQELQGEVNLMPRIELQFPQGRINTLSPKGLLATWPQAGQLLGRSGYAVVRSSLKELIPLSTGVLGHYPTTTPLIHGKKYQSFWLEGELGLEWRYRQRRREQVEMVIHHQNQYLGTTKRPLRKLKLKLNQLPSDYQTQSSLFETELGEQAIRNALNIAKAHLAYSARAAEVKFQVAFIDALDLTLDHQVTVHHESLPKGAVSGKLTGYRLERRFDKAVAQITVAVATGTGEQDPFVIDWAHKDDLKGLERVDDPAPDYFIESLSVHNQAQEQVNWLQNQENFQGVLPPGIATRIDFTLKDLRSSDVIERKFRLKDLYWSAPNQLDSKGGMS